MGSESETWKQLVSASVFRAWQRCGRLDERISKEDAKDPQGGNPDRRIEKSRLAKEKHMSDVKRYIERRKQTDRDFAENFDTGYDSFKIGEVLKQARIDHGLTQEELAVRLHTKKTAISRIENHAEDIRLSTLERYAKALDKELRVAIE
jgi:DNA-binding XRE family transcriptional regulator